MATNVMKNTYSLFGLIELPDYRYTNYHIINESHSWNTDVTKFAGFQNSFAFERAFVPIGNWVQLQTQLYWSYCFPISIAYVLIIFGIKHLMYNRQAFNLRKLLMLWNLFLAIFSILGTYRCLPEFIHIIQTDGIRASYTKSTYYAVCKFFVTNFRFFLNHFLYVYNKTGLSSIRMVSIFYRKQSI